MNHKFFSFLAMAALASGVALAADREVKVDDRLNAAADALRASMTAGDKGIPQGLLDKAQCVVIFPGMKKAGFIVGAEYGRGFASCREGKVGWTAPAAVRMEGGSFGFQIGASETDVVLLVMNQGAMRHLLADKFTLGGDASVAAGPVGRDANAETDAELHAEILAYSRSRGLFAGISVNGATLRPDESTDKELYGRDTTNQVILKGQVHTPPAAERFVHALDRDSDTRR